MKTNVPEKIYVSNYSLGLTYNWHNERLVVKDIEYTRTDAFIDKACDLLARMIWEVTYEDLEGNSTQHYDKMEFIEDFRSYMKKEIKL